MKKKRYIACAVAAVLVVLLGVGLWAVARGSRAEINDPQTLDDLAHARIGVVSGARYEMALEKRLPESTLIHLESDTDAATALSGGKVDAFGASLTAARTLMGGKPGYRYVDEPISTNEYSILLQKGDSFLQEKLNAALAELREEGILTDLQNKWLGGAYVQGQGKYSGPVPEIPHTTPPEGAVPLQVMTGCDNEPFTFYDENENPTGYDVELITLLAERLGRPVHFTVCSSSAFLPSIASGLADCAVGGLVVNADRAESYDFTDVTYSDPNLAVVLDRSVNVKPNLWELTKSNFIATFITENRWQLIAHGLLVTIELSLLSAVLGTALGFAASYPLRSQNLRVRKIATAVSAFISGTPLVVILMVMYYLLFSRVNVPPMLVGAFGFMLDLGNSLANLLNTGVASISHGQQESALALGYSKSQIFMKVTLPQAVRRIFPQYKSALVGMVKGTSIIGYITLQDLTKAGDIIRSRTYAPFFPLLMTAVLYFLLAKVLLYALHLVELRLDPKLRPRAVEGVQVHD